MPTRTPTRPAHRASSPRGFLTFVLVIAALIAGTVVWRTGVFSGGTSKVRSTGHPGPFGTRTPTHAASPTPAPTPTAGPINTTFPGLTTFRGNASRSYYGEGPVPSRPVIRWRYPTSGGLCSTSNNLGQTKVWCGTGWTGQPNVIERKDGVTEIREGAYDRNYHFLDGHTGTKVHDDLVTGDLAKGSATSDPDGYPLYYAGSRDNYFRIVALDRGTKPETLWSVNSETSVSNPIWNNDWDGAALVIGDYVLEGSENSWFYVIKINRRYDAKGKVQVDPKIVATIPGYDQQLLSDLGDNDVSIENSVAFRDGTVYFANSGGLVQGWDIHDVLNGGTSYERVFRFWDGDETDGSVVIDPDGYLYVARHASFNVQTRPQTRDHEVGSLMKLNPRHPIHPVVWSVQIGGFEPDGGILSTPALYQGVVYVNRTEGGVVAVDQQTGKVLWEKDLPGPTWGSPVPVDDRLLVGDCLGGLHAFDITDPKTEPAEAWVVHLEGCVESTPAVWKGWIWVGSRGGAIYGIADPGA